MFLWDGFVELFLAAGYAEGVDMGGGGKVEEVLDEGVEGECRRGRGRVWREREC